MLQPRIPTYIVLGRIVAVVGLSLAIALAIFFALAGKPVWAAVAGVLALPFGAMIFLVERAPGGGATESSKEHDPTS